MKVFEYENILPCDIDETLVSFSDVRESGPGRIQLVYGGHVQFFTPCWDNIALLKHHKVTRGYGIIAWSANGKEWAQTVIEALELEEYVDLVMTKPNKYLDDKPVEKWMPQQIHLGLK